MKPAKIDHKTQIMNQLETERTCQREPTRHNLPDKNNQTEPTTQDKPDRTSKTTNNNNNKASKKTKRQTPEYELDQQL